MRFSMIGIDCSMVCRIRSLVAASVGASRTSPPPSSVTSSVRWPVTPMMLLVIGCARSRSLASAVS